MFKFSVKKYHYLVSVLLICPLVWAWQVHSWMPVIFFLVFAFAGVVGEAIFSAWWHTFYTKRFWAYRVETLVHGYTSFLNFIPWGIGGLLYAFIVIFLSSSIRLSASGFIAPAVSIPFYVIFWLFFLAGLAAQFLARLHLRRFNQVVLENYLFFNFPFLLALSACVLLYGSYFISLALLFGLVAMVAEYLFGKTIKFFISKKLWVYNYEAMDSGHFTPLSLLPFSLAGFYFWSIALMVQMFR